MLLHLILLTQCEQEVRQRCRAPDDDDDDDDDDDETFRRILQHKAGPWTKETQPVASKPQADPESI